MIDWNQVEFDKDLTYGVLLFILSFFRLHVDYSPAESLLLVLERPD